MLGNLDLNKTISSQDLDYASTYEAPNKVQRLFRKEVECDIRKRGNLNMKKYIVYLTLCTVNHKIYIGVHGTDNPYIFDGYIGNSVYVDTPSSYKKSKTPFQYAVNKYGVDNFKRITLKVFDNIDAAFEYEQELVDETFIRREDTYNVRVGGAGGCPPTKFVEVYMYDLEGNFVKKFINAFECNRFLDPKCKNGSSVLKALRLGQILHGFQFSKEYVPFMKNYAPKRGSHYNKIKVGRYDELGHLLETFDSITQCVNAGYKNVSKAIKRNKKCKGFYFKKL